MAKLTSIVGARGRLEEKQVGAVDWREEDVARARSVGLAKEVLVPGENVGRGVIVFGNRAGPGLAVPVGVLGTVCKVAVGDASYFDAVAGSQVGD